MFSNQNISTYDSNSDSYEIVMWEQGEDYTNKDDECESDSPDIFDSSPSSLPPTPRLSLATSSLALSSQEPPPCPFDLPKTSRKKLGRPFKRRYFGNQYTAVKSDDSINTSADTSSHTPTPKKKKFILTLPGRGYTSQIKSQLNLINDLFRRKSLGKLVRKITNSQRNEVTEHRDPCASHQEISVH